MKAIHILKNRLGNKDLSKANNLQYFIFDLLIINRFTELEDIFRYTPNLTNLIISYGPIKKLYADDILNTIESLLLLLRVFKFNFAFYYRQHRWFTEYTTCLIGIYIYTQYQS